MRLFDFSTENNLIELKTNVKLFADYTSLCTIIEDIIESANALNNDLSLIAIQIPVNQTKNYYSQEKRNSKFIPL